MGRFPVFQSPFLDAAQKRMEESGDKLHSFLGDDQRQLFQILAADGAELNALGLDHEEMGGLLAELVEEGKKGLGTPVLVRDRFLVVVETARGKMGCPFGHPGLFRKTHAVIVNQKTGESMALSDLSVHLIAAHGFFQGEGSPYRLSPEKAASVLELPGPTR